MRPCPRGMMLMKNFEFTIVASGLPPETEDFETRFFEAGCDDATISFQKGLIILEFDRSAKSFSHAMLSAFEDVHKAGAKVERFEPDYLVSLTDIANRAGISKAAVSLYAKGERGSGFPLPIARVTSESPLWDWVEVSRWMHQQHKIPFDRILEARLMREANVVLRHERAPRDKFAARIEALTAE